MLNDLIRAATECGLKPVRAGKNDCYGMIDGVFVTLVGTGNGNFLLNLLLGRAVSEGGEPDGETGEKAARAQEIVAANDVGGDPHIFLTSDQTITAVIHLTVNKKSAETLRAFLQTTLPALKNAGFGGPYACAECGEVIPENDVAYYDTGAAVRLMHSDCCEKKLRGNELKAVEENDEAHALRGALGALLGALAGAALYLGVGLLGYVASLVGLATGWLTELLYRRFGGKNGWKKFVALGVALILSVALGQTLCLGYSVLMGYGDTDYEENGVSRAEYTLVAVKSYITGDDTEYLGWDYDVHVRNIAEADRGRVMSREEYIETYYTQELRDDTEAVRSQYLKDMAMGLLYSALGGAFFIYRNSKSEHTRARRLAA